MSDTKREALGRLVREEWVRFAREQTAPKASHLVEWDELDSSNREVDCRIGEALFLQGAASTTTDGIAAGLSRALVADIHSPMCPNHPDKPCIGMTEKNGICVFACAIDNARATPGPGPGSCDACGGWGVMLLNEQPLHGINCGICNGTGRTPRAGAGTAPAEEKP